jgi:hypothetical protein
MMLAIRDAVNDMSPYVRKTAANAIAKLYAYVNRLIRNEIVFVHYLSCFLSCSFSSLDSDLKDELISIITKLLADKTIVRSRDSLMLNIR